MERRIVGRMQLAGAVHAALFGLLCAACGSPAGEADASSDSGNKLCGGTDETYGEGGSASVKPAWSKILANVDYADIAADAGDNLLLAGEVYFPPADLGGIAVTGRGMFVAKLDPKGQPLWARPLGDWNVFSVAVDSAANVLILGRSPQIAWGAPPPNLQLDKIYLAKLSPNGELLWNRTMGGQLVAMVDSLNLITNTAGEIVVQGVFQGEIDVGDGTVLASKDIEHTDLFLARFDPAGALLQALHFAATGSGYREGHIAAHPSDRVIVSGALRDMVDLGGVMLPGYGATAFVAEIDAGGTALWGKSFSSENSGQSGIRGAVTAAGEVMIAGTFDGPADFGAGPLPFEGTDSPFLLRLDGSGHSLDSRGYPGAGAKIQDLAAGPTGELAFSGWFRSGTLDFGGGPITCEIGERDAFVVKLDDTGAHRLTFVATGPGEQEGRAAAFSPSGTLYAAASYHWGLEINGEVLVDVMDPTPNGYAASGTLLIAMPP